MTKPLTPRSDQIMDLVRKLRHVVEEDEYYLIRNATQVAIEAIEIELRAETKKEREVWLRSWCAVASSPGGTTDICDHWADKCLKAFKERFP